MKRKLAYDAADRDIQNVPVLGNFRDSSEAMQRSEEAERMSEVQKLRARSAVSESRLLLQRVGLKQDDREPGKA